MKLIRGDVLLRGMEEERRIRIPKLVLYEKRRERRIRIPKLVIRASDVG